MKGKSEPRSESRGQTFGKNMQSNETPAAPSQDVHSCGKSAEGLAGMEYAFWELPQFILNSSSDINLKKFGFVEHYRAETMTEHQQRTKGKPKSRELSSTNIAVLQGNMEKQFNVLEEKADNDRNNLKLHPSNEKHTK